MSPPELDNLIGRHRGGGGDLPATSRSQPGAHQPDLAAAVYNLSDCYRAAGIVSGYRADAAGQIKPVLLSPGNDDAEAWGLRLYRSTLHAFCSALEADGGLPGDDVRPLVHQVMDAFRCHPSRAEALAWGAYPYDSDPAGTAVRPLARPFAAETRPTRGDRAWLAGSLALSTPEAQAAYLRHAPADEIAGAPETDFRISDLMIGAGGLSSFVATPDRHGCSLRSLVSGGFLKFDYQLSGHTSAVLHFNALRLGPLANLGGVQPAGRGPASISGWPPGTAASPAGSTHVAC